MANYALVKNNAVQNVIVAEADFIDYIKADWDEIVEVTEGLHIIIGSKKVKNKWVPPVQEEAVSTNQVAGE